MEEVATASCGQNGTLALWLVREQRNKGSRLSPALNIALLYFFITSEFSLAFYREGGITCFGGKALISVFSFLEIPKKNGGFCSQSLITSGPIKKIPGKERTGGTFDSSTAGYGTIQQYSLVGAPWVMAWTGSVSRLEGMRATGFGR